MKIVLIAGARPNFMKIAPLIRAIGELNKTRDGLGKIEYTLVHTGQHYDESMSAVFFRELGIPEPKVNLMVGSGSHAVQTAQIMLKCEPVLLAERPDWVVVVGDVNSTMACAIVASKLRIKVCHVEAGLRSFDRTMPEEINRVLTDAIADLLLTPSVDADENLKREGVPAEKITMVGNIMIDSVLHQLEHAESSNILKNLEIQPGEFVFVTLHRPANVDDGDILNAVLNKLKDLSRQLRVIFAIHPRTKKMLGSLGISMESLFGIRMLEPLGYHDSLCLTKNARLVVTDSGGLQEEATFFRTPCLTLRPNTERPVTIVLGSNKLTDAERLSIDIAEALCKPERLGTIPPLWDGKAAYRILECLDRHT